MESWITLLDRLAYPASLLLVSLALLFGAQRLRQMGGGKLVGLGLLCWVAAIGCAVFHPQLRELMFSAQHLPATLCVAVTPLVAWWTRRQHSPPTLLDIPQEPEPSSGFGRGDGLVALGVVGFVACLALFIEPPVGPAAGELLLPSRLPWYLAGWQEMRTVIRPGLGGVIVWLIVAGLLALPYLEVTPDDPSESGSRREATRLFLFFSLVLGFVPMVVGVYLRDAQWRLQGLLGPRQQDADPLGLADAFWLHGVGMAPPQAWFWRQLPGLFAIAAYLVVLWVVLPRWRASRGLFQRYRKALGEPRYRAALVLFAALGWVPLKLAVYWLFAIGDWVVLPFWPGGL